MAVQDLLENPPNLPWTVQKFGGTSIGKHAAKVRLPSALVSRLEASTLNPLKILLTLLAACRLPLT